MPDCLEEISVEYGLEGAEWRVVIILDIKKELRQQLELWDEE